MDKKYTNFEVEKMLESMAIIADTREQPTARFRKRMKATGRPWERQKLDYGDYSAVWEDLGGNKKSLLSIVAIERKMNLDECCMCFSKERKRFEREFERAKADGARIWLIIEEASWEKVFGAEYRSKLNPDSLIGSLLAWSIRYDLRLIFCEPKDTGKLIFKILRYELKERLENESKGE